ncbi:uncharacterized protein SS50377_28754 [Spironucleus salmonicida]|uniref:Uncharacterized protein n=1 Tax=Spironucleus salmonicida TaxID=348837 RepID=A0A9P8RUE9_9EUKA|nr:hypothetical protein SS50377_28754 [Spironucleus salmonicida]
MQPAVMQSVFVQKVKSKFQSKLCISLIASPKPITILSYTKVLRMTLNLSSQKEMLILNYYKIIKLQYQLHCIVDSELRGGIRFELSAHAYIHRVIFNLRDKCSICLRYAITNVQIILEKRIDGVHAGYPVHGEAHMAVGILIKNISLIMRYVDTGHIYVQYVHGGSITAAKSEDVFNLLERTSVPHKFMFLNPTFDYAFQNFNKDPTISIYEQVLDDSVAAANETFQLLRYRSPAQTESTNKEDESSIKEAIVEQDGGTQDDVSSTTQIESTTKKGNPPPQKSIWSRIQDRTKMLLMQVYTIKTISQENQCKAQENLKYQETCPMLIIVIPFNKKMCFTDSLDKARHKIFDFIVTFHGYPDLGLEKIDGCQVLPIECGHHVPEVLAEKVKAFTLNNVLQIGLDKKGAHLILDVNYKSQNWQYNLQKAEDLVKLQQQTEKDKNVKHAEILQSEKQKIVKHSFYKISCRQDCYTESFIEFLKINIPFNVFQIMDLILFKQNKSQTRLLKINQIQWNNFRNALILIFNSNHKAQLNLNWVVLQ